MSYVGGNNWGPFYSEQRDDGYEIHNQSCPYQFGDIGFGACICTSYKVKEDAIQETIPFEDETTVAGKKYPLLIMPCGLFIYKDEIPPQEPKSPEPDSGPVLFIPNKNKKSAKKIKMHPMTGVAIRAKQKKP